MPSLVELRAQDARDIRNSFSSYFSTENILVREHYTDVSIGVYSRAYDDLRAVAIGAISLLNSLETNIKAIDPLGFFGDNMELTGLWNLIRTNVEDNTLEIENLIGTAYTAIYEDTRRAVSDAEQRVKNALTDVQNYLTSGISTRLVLVEQTIKTVKDDLLAAFNRKATEIQGSIAGVVTALNSQFNTQLSLIGGMFDTMALSVRKGISDSVDDIARRIWEYFRDFFFERVE